MSGTVLPYDRAAERAVLGACIQTHASYDRAATTLGEDHFHLWQHRHLWNALALLDDVGGFYAHLDNLDVWTDEELWPIQPPGSMEVRAAALWAIVDGIALRDVRALTRWASQLDHNIAKLHDAYRRRVRALELDEELRRLTGQVDAP